MFVVLRLHMAGQTLWQPPDIRTWRPGSSLQRGGTPQQLPIRQPPQQGTAARQGGGLHRGCCQQRGRRAAALAPRPQAALHKATAPAAAAVRILPRSQSAARLSLAPAEATAATPCKMRARSSHCLPAIPPVDLDFEQWLTLQVVHPHNELVCGPFAAGRSARSMSERQCGILAPCPALSTVHPIDCSWVASGRGKMVG